MNCIEKAIKLMPTEIADKLSRMDTSAVEEIRIRVGKRPSVVMLGEEEIISENAVSRAELDRIIEKATGASYHMAEQSMSEGYIDYGGLRIGLCGRVNMQKNKLYSMGRIDSIAIRIPAEHKGIADELFECLYIKDFESTLLLSPPGGGKTSLLREMCRILSQKGLRLGIVDERNELLASDGEKCFDLGEHSDVISSVPKALGSLMMLRSMNPQIIAMDEITKEEDVEAISQLVGCGVKLLASAHALDCEDLLKRPLYRKLLQLNVFEYAIQIKSECGKRVYLAEGLDQ